MCLEKKSNKFRIIKHSFILTSVGSSEEMKLAFSFAYSKLSQLSKKEQKNL